MLDRPLAHPADDDRCLEQVAAVLREEPARAGGVDVVAGTADTLEPGGHRLGRLDLHDQVDRAHVDPELERRCGHERGQAAGLQHLLDLEPLLAGDRAVVRAGDLLLGQVVQAMGDALGGAAAVHEDERRAVGAHQLEEARIDRGPDRLARLAVGRRGATQLAHVGHRHDHLEIERLAVAGVDDLDGPVAAQEPGDLVERPLGRREPDPLRVAAGQVREPLEREREVRPALAGRQGMDLVDDDRLDAGQHLARGRRQDQIQRLRRRDEDVGRAAAHRGPLALGRVAASHRDLHLARGLDAVKRRTQVSLDVVVQGLERADVEHARAALRRVADEAVDGGQEGGERLPGAGRRQHQRVLPGGDGRPALGLGRRGPLEAPPEPVGDGRGERTERVGSHPRSLPMQQRGQTPMLQSVQPPATSRRTNTR